jgi:FkbM family methyltransferase
LTFSKGLWQVTDGVVQMRFEHYPYLAFHDIEGYFRDKNDRLEPGMTVVDAGACRGEFALYASCCVGPTGKVIVLEPDPENLQLAKRTFELNGNPSNIEVCQVGLWSSRGSVMFSAGDSDTSQVVDLKDGDSIPSNSMKIETESLTSLVERCRLSSLDFVKMDIEGAEIEAIQGAAKLPSPFRPRYAIASYHIVNGQKTAVILPGLFSDLGYETYSGNERHLTTYAWPAINS